MKEDSSACDSMLRPTIASGTRSFVAMVGGVRSVGRMSDLEVNHMEFRRRLGDDSEVNLITLCTLCHSSAHHLS